MRISCILISVLMFAFCTERKEPRDQATHHEAYRPHFHFSPQKNWTNDPNGLVYHDGEYHLFYQYNPFGDTWGHMSWGHAVSKDLFHWEHLPVALEEYIDPVSGDSTMVFSGTVVVDKSNSSGFGENAMVAIYTSHAHHNNEGKVQHQSLAYSLDKGRTWKRYKGNPVLDIGRKDFRDPKVFWYEPQGKWVMALVVPDLFKVQFYESANLKEWKLMSEFGPAGDTARIWECPDLYLLPVENEPGMNRWVLSLSGSHPQGSKFVGMQYFTGDFDGKKFTADGLTPRYVDYGKDFYAGIVFNNVPEEDGRTIMLGWMNNWTYANLIPTSPWRGAMSVPRELSLRKTGDDYLLIQRPVRELKSIRGKEIEDIENYSGNSFEMEFELPAGSQGAIVELFASGNEKTVVGITDGFLWVDRTQAGRTDFHPDFGSVEKVRLVNPDQPIKLRILVDRSSIEVFADDGESALTDLVFPTARSNKINIIIKDKIKKLRAWEIESVW